MTERFEYRGLTVGVGRRGFEPDDMAALEALGGEGWQAVGFAPSHASGRGLRVETTEYVVLLMRRVPAPSRSPGRRSG